MADASETIATLLDTEILTAVRNLADSEGRPVQALVNEALADLIEKRRHAVPRAHVMATYQTSHDKFGPLYKKLAE